MKRADGREPQQIRATTLRRRFTKWAEGSVLIEIGGTMVVCTASVDDRVPPFRRNTGMGWVTAEYGMLPRSTEARTNREVTRTGPSGRTMEIQRLIGRSLRAVTNMEMLGERTIAVDCDVIQADGGTRTAAITGGCMALYDALTWLRDKQYVPNLALSEFVAAVSVGIVDGVSMLDLDYREDCNAQVDMNVVMTGSGKLVEVQGTAESSPFACEDLGRLLELAQQGIKELLAVQQQALLGDRL